jgi:hypothetical protein
VTDNHQHNYIGGLLSIKIERRLRWGALFIAIMVLEVASKQLTKILTKEMRDAKGARCKHS